MDNLQSCFGAYGTNGIVDSYGLLREIEKIVERIGINNLDIKISAVGYPNNCAIAIISDIGFWGVVEPVVDLGKCTGCDICLKVCKVGAIEIKDGGEPKLGKVIAQFLSEKEALALAEKLLIKGKQGEEL